MKHLIYSAVLLLVMTTGCEKNDGPTSSTDPIDREIVLTPIITKVVKAPQLNEDGSGTFNEGDTFTLYAYDDAKGSSAIDYTLGLTTLLWRDLDFVEEGKTVNFVACYPPQVLDGDRFDFTVGQNSASDLLLASAVQAHVGEEQPVVLTFRHAMHRLVVNFTIKDSSIGAESIKTRCTAYSSCEVRLTTGSLTRGEEKETYSMDGPEATFLLLPQATQDVVLEVEVGKISKRWVLAALDPSYENLEPGKELKVNLTITSENILFSGMTIEGWGDQGTITGDIII